MTLAHPPGPPPFAPQVEHMVSDEWHSVLSNSCANERYKRETLKRQFEYSRNEARKAALQAELARLDSSGSSCRKLETHFARGRRGW